MENKKIEIVSQTNKIGLDFGTTYSIMAGFDETRNKLSVLPCVAGDTDKMYDSLVLVSDAYLNGRNEKDIFCGKTARINTGNYPGKSFRGFKLMLLERDLNRLKDEGYSNELKPEDIVKIYLKYLLQLYLPLEKLVVGIPLDWKKHPFDGNTYQELKDILEEIGATKDSEGIEFLKEPLAACGYFAYNYQRINTEFYKGYILIVDYGGGTLDVTLCKVDKCKIDKDKKENIPEIEAIGKSGAGFNFDGTIGSAGLEFIERVVIVTLENALSEQGKSKEEITEVIMTLKQKGKIADAAFNVESSLKLLSTQINDDDEWIVSFKEAFKEVTIENLNDLINNKDDYSEIVPKYSFPIALPIFVQGKVFYDDPVAYPLEIRAFARAYKEVIYTPLNNSLQSIKEQIDDLNKKNETIYLTSNSKNTKIQLIGGFSNFYVVKRQVFTKFHGMGIDIDLRDKDTIQDVESINNAVAYGATLYANGKTRFIPTSDYAISLDWGEKLEAIHLNMKYEPNHIYFFENDQGFPAVLLVTDSIAQIEITNCFGDAKPESIPNPITPGSSQFCVCGVSYNEKERVTFHQWSVSGDVTQEYDNIRGELAERLNRDPHCGILGGKYEYRDLAKVMKADSH